MIKQRCELQVMSEVQKQKQHPIPLRLEAPLKSKSASLPTRLDSGGAGNAVKGQDERLKRAPLTAFPAPMLSCALFTLDSRRCRHTRDQVLYPALLEWEGPIGRARVRSMLSTRTEFSLGTGQLLVMWKTAKIQQVTILRATGMQQAKASEKVRSIGSVRMVF